MFKEKITILGDGGWGTTLAILLSKKGYRITLWSVSSEYAKYLDKKRDNPKFLPYIKIPAEIFITSCLEKSIVGARVIILAIPSQYLRNILKQLKDFNLKNKIIVSAVKGIENSTLMRASQILNVVLGIKEIAVLSGPTIAQEVAKGIPSAAVVACKDRNVARKLQSIFTTERFRIYTNNDVIGTELGGSLKNVIALACGISDGLGFGSNTKAALLTRGIVEMMRLGVKLGARKETFMGISGLGDLITTCFSPFSRNRQAGEQIGRGKSLKEVLSSTEMVAEGIPTTKSVYTLSIRYKVEMPITREVYSVIFKNKNPLKAVRDLMTRTHKQEY